MHISTLEAHRPLVPLPLEVKTPSRAKGKPKSSKARGKASAKIAMAPQLRCAAVRLQGGSDHEAAVVLKKRLEDENKAKMFIAGNLYRSSVANDGLRAKIKSMTKELAKSRSKAFALRMQLDAANEQLRASEDNAALTRSSNVPMHAMSGAPPPSLDKKRALSGMSGSTSRLRRRAGRRRRRRPMPRSVARNGSYDEEALPAGGPPPPLVAQKDGGKGSAKGATKSHGKKRKIALKPRVSRKRRRRTEV